MAKEGFLHDAFVKFDKKSNKLIKRCRVCRTDLAKAELIRAWESDGRKNFIYACPKCGRFNLFFRKRSYGRDVSNRMVG